MVEIDTLKGTVTSQAIESFAITLMHKGKALIQFLWILGVVHVEYVHYHPVDDLFLAIMLEM